MNSLLRNILKTHEDLNEEDINYGEKLLELYYGNITLLVRLLKNNYIGKISNNFNNDIDKMIKERNLSRIELFCPLSTLVDKGPTSDSSEKGQNKLMENLAIIAMKNMIEFLKVEDYPDNQIFSKNGLYDLFLKDACSDANFPYQDFNTEVYENCEYECGKYIRVKKIKFIKN